jgi:hypothetical protein
MTVMIPVNSACLGAEDIASMRPPIQPYGMDNGYSGTGVEHPQTFQERVGLIIENLGFDAI